jgi:peptidoglycan hydrolase-like protein with peptidoglycan-binding domain
LAAFCVVAGAGVAACADSREASERDATIPRISAESTSAPTSTTQPFTPTTAETTTTATTSPPAQPPTQAPAVTLPPTAPPTDPRPPVNPPAQPDPGDTGGPTSTVVVTAGPRPECSPDGIGVDTGFYTISDVSCHGGWAVGLVDECPPDRECEGRDVFHVTDRGWVHDGYHPAVCAEGLIGAGMSIYTAMAFTSNLCDDDPGQTQIIRPDSSGERVTHLQFALVANGYDISVDGTYGPRTQAAVRNFQAGNNLEVDGIAGPQTQSALGIGPGGDTATPASIASPATTTLRTTAPGATSTVVVTPGEPVDCIADAVAADIGTGVREIVECRAGWAIGRIEPCPQNTICEEADIFHVTENGWVHDGVFSALCAEHLVEAGMSAHTAGDFGTYCGEDLRQQRENILPDSTGPDVVYVQTALAALGYPIDVDGRYGPRTQAAVRDFQAANDLDVDGIAGPMTQQALGI